MMDRFTDLTTKQIRDLWHVLGDTQKSILTHLVKNRNRLRRGSLIQFTPEGVDCTTAYCIGIIKQLQERARFAAGDKTISIFRWRKGTKSTLGYWYISDGTLAALQDYLGAKDAPN